jgi:transcriptional regulator with XRE-family HTH domain
MMPWVIEDRLGQRLRQERERRGWSQQEVAERLRALNVNVHPSAVAKMEARGVATPRTFRLGEAWALAALFEMPLDELLDAAADTAGGRALSALRRMADPLADARILLGEVMFHARQVSPEAHELEELKERLTATARDMERDARNLRNALSLVEGRSEEEVEDGVDQKEA